jgi:primosomal protein N''
MSSTELKNDLGKLAFLFSLCLEDYIGDLDELKEMAEVDDALINAFLSGKLFSEL